MKNMGRTGGGPDLPPFRVAPSKNCDLESRSKIFSSLVRDPVFQRGLNMRCNWWNCIWLKKNPINWADAHGQRNLSSFFHTAHGQQFMILIPGLDRIVFANSPLGRFLHTMATSVMGAVQQYLNRSSQSPESEAGAPLSPCQWLFKFARLFYIFIQGCWQSFVFGDSFLLISGSLS